MIGFCITCKGRLQHVKKTLPINLEHNQSEHSKFVLVDYSSQDGLKEYLIDQHKDAIASGKLVVYSFLDQSLFRMAHAKNMAHRCGILEGCDVLCNLDADNLTGPNFDLFIQGAMTPKHFLWARMYTQENGRRPRGISGRIVVTDKAFLKVGGYDEKYAAWGHDDRDINSRLLMCGYEPIEIPKENLDVVLHTNRLRFQDYPHLAQNADSNDAMTEPESCIANFGSVGVGTVFKNYDYSKPIEIKPIPTRIFGIGMHKTGTTSLHHALKILDFDSGHWNDAHWAKAIWREMSVYGKSRTLEYNHAVSDLPITVLYEELDRAYPGSKFILTTRNEGAWLKSVENHWDHKSNPFREAWSTDPFTHKIHKVLYGQKGFDALIFLARFRRHNQEVLEYFKDRPQDLLVMDMSNGSGWPDLCSFLDRPIPSCKYPKKLTTPDL
jgi:hypothetical protein